MHTLTHYAGHHVYLAVDDMCHHYTIHQDVVHHEDIADVACVHVEADTRIVFRLSSLPQNHNLTVSVRCSDTDLFILWLHHIVYGMSHKPSVWMDVSLGANNTRGFIFKICELANHIDKDIIQKFV